MKLLAWFMSDILAGLSWALFQIGRLFNWAANGTISLANRLLEEFE